MRTTTATLTMSSRTLACRSRCWPASTTPIGMEQSPGVCVSSVPWWSLCIVVHDHLFCCCCCRRPPAKENVSMQAYALTNQNDQAHPLYSSFFEPTPLDGSKSIDYIDNKLFTKGFLVPLALVITTIVVILVVIVAVCKFHSGTFEIASV